MARLRPRLLVLSMILLPVCPGKPEECGSSEESEESEEESEMKPPERSSSSD